MLQQTCFPGQKLKLQGWLINGRLYIPDLEDILATKARY